MLGGRSGAPGCLAAFLALPDTYRKLSFLIITLLENLFTIHGFDGDHYTEQMVFAVFVIHPVIMRTSAAMSRTYPWETTIPFIASQALAELTQTYLFVKFCSFDPIKSAFLVACLAAQLMLLVVEQRWESMRCCRTSVSLSTCSQATTSLWHGMLADASYKEELRLLLFGAVTSVLPLFCKTGDTESELGSGFTESERQANAFIRFFAGSLFSLILTMFLWALDVLAFEKTVDPLAKNFVWLFCVQSVYYYAIVYASLTGLAALLSSGFILMPLALSIIGVVVPVIRILAPFMAMFAGLYALAGFIDCIAECDQRQSRNSIFAKDVIRQPPEFFGKIALQLMLLLMYVIIATAIVALGKHFIPMVRFLIGCGGLLLFWSIINITFIVVAAADCERIHRHRVTWMEIITKPNDGIIIAPGQTEEANEAQELGRSKQGEQRLLQPGQLEVRFKRAFNLRVADVTGASDPYVIIQLGQLGDPYGPREAGNKKASGHLSWTSTTRPRSLNPIWDELGSWRFASLQEALALSCATLQVWDRDTFTKDDPLGSLEFELSGLADVDSVTFERVRLRDVATGEVSFDVVWVPDDAAYMC
jgi:hypothetical protein